MRVKCGKCHKWNAIVSMYCGIILLGFLTVASEKVRLGRS